MAQDLAAPYALAPRRIRASGFSAWFERQALTGGRRGEGLSDAGKAALRWVISNHLLPAFASRLPRTGS